MYFCSELQNKNNMKTRIFTILFALAATTLHAQDDNMGCIPFHNINYEIFVMENMMQQRNGEIITNLFIAVDDPEHPHYPIYVGDIVHKMSPATLQFTDSLFIADSSHTSYYLYAQNPLGEGNIRASFEYDGNRDSTYLLITHFSDNDLQIDSDNDIITPLCEGEALEHINSYMVDCRGDLIMKYYKTVSDQVEECHITRFGPDGTFKYEATLPQSQNFLENVRVLSESPLQYYHWKGGGSSNMTCYVLDSAFNTITSSIFSRIIYEIPVVDSSGSAMAREYLEFASDTEVIPDGEDMLVAAKYTQDSTILAGALTAEHGLAVARYDLRTMQRKNLILFDDLPGWSSEATCNGLQRTSDGAIYLLYSEREIYSGQKVTFAVKMDHDFNVEWKRYCKPVERFQLRTEHCIPATDEEGNEVMAVAGSSIDLESYAIGIFYFFIHHDGTVSVDEGMVKVRPYTFYPNPTQSQLRMAFSPDVQPSLVELYDLQGRRILSQGNAFERIDMSRLPVGIYTLRVTLQDGQVFSDKVVKE